VSVRTCDLRNDWLKISEDSGRATGKLEHIQFIVLGCEVRFRGGLPPGTCESPWPRARCQAGASAMRPDPDGLGEWFVKCQFARRKDEVTTCQH
jgi:hypothetical protein